MPRMNWMISMVTTPTLAICTLLALDISQPPPRILSPAIRVGHVRSVLSSPPSSSEKKLLSGNRLLIIGIAAFVLGFGGWLAFLALHLEDWTLNMIDLSV